MPIEAYKNFRYATIENLSAGKNLTGRQKVEAFQGYVKTNISNILNNKEGLRIEDFRFLKNHPESEGLRHISVMIGIFEGIGAAISEGDKVQIRKILNSPAIINLDRAHLAKLFGIDTLSQETIVKLMKHKRKFDEMYSYLLTRQILLTEFEDLKTEDIEVFDRDRTSSGKFLTMKNEEIAHLINEILGDDKLKSGQGMFFNALIPEKAGFVLKSERKIDNPKSKEYQRRSISHFGEVKLCFDEKFLPSQIVLNSKQNDRFFVLQEKIDIPKMKLLKYIILDDALKDFKICIHDEENRRLLEDFIEGMERLYTEKKLLIDALGDNIFYEIIDGKLKIKLIDTGCFETFYDDISSERRKDIMQMEDFIKRMKTVISEEGDEASDKTQISSLVRILSQKLKEKEFAKKFAPLSHYRNEEITEVQIESRILRILDSNLKIPKSEIIKLINDAINYYSQENSHVRHPAYHSTNSFTLRKALEEGFEGGHGAYNGEHQVLEDRNKAIEQKSLDYDPQQSLSVSINPDNHEYVEYFQQLYARVNCRRGRLTSLLSLDSSDFGLKNTLSAMDQILSYEIKDAEERTRKDVAKRLKKTYATDQEIAQYKNEMLGAVDNREYAPNKEHPEITEYLKRISGDPTLTREIAEELNEPFPCYVTFDGNETKEGFSRLFGAYDKEVSSVPCEDRFRGKLYPEHIREIRVPLGQISKVQRWLADKGLNMSKVIPIELFEIKRILGEEAL